MQSSFKGSGSYVLAETIMPGATEVWGRIMWDVDVNCGELLAARVHHPNIKSAEGSR